MVDVTDLQRFDWRIRGLPVRGAPMDWTNGPALWKCTVDLEPLEPDTPFGDRFVMPSRVRFRFVGEQPAPTVVGVVRVRNRWPELESLEVHTGIAGGVRTADIRNIHVDALIEQVAELTSVAAVPAAGGFELVDHEGAAGRAVRNAKRVGRPKVDPEKVRRAAEIYREHLPGGRPIQAVADALGLKPRTAARYIERARSTEFQLLPATEQGRAKA